MILRAVLIIILLFIVGSGFAPAQTVSIPDSNLRAKIETALGKVSGATLTAAEMATLSYIANKRSGK